MFPWRHGQCQRIDSALMEMLATGGSYSRPAAYFQGNPAPTVAKLEEVFVLVVAWPCGGSVTTIP